ncbi:porin family protein [Larkinella soli]|uniref:porin family protein n=1 Tax=Larkinella soli TaxID=1770527 RepID=UPI000FFB0FE0|nr:porin family protein [Larkinella soli]
MKRGIVYGLIFLFAITTSGMAQQRWSAGPRLGLNLSTFVGDVDNNKLLPGVTAGGFIMYSDINHFGVSADLLFSQRGSRYKISDPTREFKFTQRINYLEVPVLFRYFLNLSGNFRPNLFLGPNLGIKLNATRTDPDRKYDNGNIFRPADLGATVGLSLNFRVKEAQRLHLDARYTLGLSDITDPAKAPTPDGNVRNSTISFLVGYGFGIGRRY